MKKKEGANKRKWKWMVDTNHFGIWHLVLGLSYRRRSGPEVWSWGKYVRQKKKRKNLKIFWKKKRNEKLLEGFLMSHSN